MSTANNHSMIWSGSVSERLSSARALSKAALAEVQADLCESCPVQPWPYGNATTINPMLVTLGKSPGNSPEASDPHYAGKPLELPPAGKRHPHTTYNDTKKFWHKVRYLVRSLLNTETTTEEDAYALFGNMNLNPNRSGQASAVQLDRDFANWVLRTIRDQLRPRFLVCLGLKSDPQANYLLEQAFPDFNPKQPQNEHELVCYQHGVEKRLIFKEWDCRTPAGSSILIVHWPQHPSKPPFTYNGGMSWQEACQDFSARHQSLVQP